MKRKSVSPKQRSGRLERRILLGLACFSIASGIWNNFRQLWLQDNGFAVQDVGTLLSLGTVVSVLGILWIGRHVKMSQLKSVMVLILMLKLANLFILFNLNGSGLLPVITLCTLLDIFLGYAILTSFYPLLTTVVKNNTVYSRRKLVEYLFCDLGVLIGSVLLGQELAGRVLDYNACILVVMFFLVLAVTVLSSFRIKITHHEAADAGSVVKRVWHSKMQRCYLIYILLSSCAFATAMGLKVLVLTNDLHFSDNAAMVYVLAVGLVADVIGILALRCFTPKNDYLTLTLKFGLRLVAYVIAVVADNSFIFLLAMTWSIMISTAFENVTDGYYINTIDNRHQLSYNSLRYMVTCLGEAIGLFLCGLMYDYGLGYMFGLAALITVPQLGLAYYLIHLRRRRRTYRHSASRLRYDERTIEENGLP